MDNLKGKVIIITGANSGIGKATAILLAKKGAFVVLAARNEAKLNAVLEEIKTEEGEAFIVPTDVTKKDEVENLVQKTLKKYGKIDVMMNDAGIMAIAPLSELKVDQWELMVDVNIKGLLFGIAAVLPVFLKQGYGHFVDMSSVAGIKVLPNGTVYSGTKFAIRAITEGIRQELGHIIRSVSIEPGAVNTPLIQDTDAEDREELERLYQKALRAEDIARAIAFIINQPAEVDINQIVIRPSGIDI